MSFLNRLQFCIIIKFVTKILTLILTQSILVLMTQTFSVAVFSPHRTEVGSVLRLVMLARYLMTQDSLVWYQLPILSVGYRDQWISLIDSKSLLYQLVLQSLLVLTPGQRNTLQKLVTVMRRHSLTPQISARGKAKGKYQGASVSLLPRRHCT